MPNGRILRPGELEPAGYGQVGSAAVEGGEPLRMFEPQATSMELPEQLKNRQKYETFLTEKYGNPYEDERNLINRINETTRTSERALFEHVFGDNFRYEDRKHLDSKAQSHWKNALLKHRKRIETSLKQDIKSRKEMFQEQMKAFDSYTKALKPAKPKYTLKNITDYFEKKAYDKDGNYTGLTQSQTMTINDMITKSDSGLELITETVPAQKSWFGDIGEPNIPAMDMFMLQKTDSAKRRPGESIEQYLKRTGR